MQRMVLMDKLELLSELQKTDGSLKLSLIQLKSPGRPGGGF